MIRLWELDTDTLPLASRWLAAEENYRWLDFGKGVQALPAPMLQLMRRSDQHCLRLFGRNQTGPIGLVALSDIVPAKGTATLWYLLGAREHGGRGYTTRAVTRLLDYGFRSLGLQAIDAWAAVENRASIAVLEKCGFRPVGRQRRCHLLNGRPTDRLLFDLLSDEYMELICNTKRKQHYK